MLARILVNFVITLSFSALFCAPKPASNPEVSLDLQEFVRLIADLSEPEGYFDSDNFVSNEGAYLKILPDLKRQGISGGAYIGVGPDQNYSYIAQIKPQIAFLIDIRRHNALEHLYFKALFQLSFNRLQYLERLFGKNLKGPVQAPQNCSISELLRFVDASSSDKAFAEKKLLEAIQVIRSWDGRLNEADYESIRFVAQAFMAQGPDLKFTSFNRPPRSQYPSYRQLLEETDSEGTQANYLATEENFLLIKKLHRENRIIPIVGDLGGSYALAHTGDELRRRKIALTCFYVSNVEFYLFRGTRWDSYIRNLSNLPRAQNALLIRSYANFGRLSAQPSSGYYMETTIQSIQQFLAQESAGQNNSYWNLIPHSPQR
jgi:hypothetical protein